MQFNTSEFFYKGGTFYGEASDLQHRFSWLFVGPDRGFQLISERTGAIVKMIFDKSNADAEDEISYWRWIPVDCDAFDALIMFND